MCINWNLTFLLHLKCFPKSARHCCYVIFADQCYQKYAQCHIFILNSCAQKICLKPRSHAVKGFSEYIKKRSYYIYDIYVHIQVQICICIRLIIIFILTFMNRNWRELLIRWLLMRYMNVHIYIRQTYICASVFVGKYLWQQLCFHSCQNFTYSYLLLLTYLEEYTSNIESGFASLPTDQ